MNTYLVTRFCNSPAYRRCLHSFTKIAFAGLDMLCDMAQMTAPTSICDTNSANWNHAGRNSYCRTVLLPKSRLSFSKAQRQTGQHTAK